MTAKERAKFNKRLDNIAWEANLQATKACAEISLPLEIEALERMVEGLQRAIEMKKYKLDSIKEMKTENMTFSEALEAMKQGYKVRRKEWGKHLFWYIENKTLKGAHGEDIELSNTFILFATDWKIYTEPKPEPQFEIGELVMMRFKGCNWLPKHFSRKLKSPDYNRHYESTEGYLYHECAKFDKNIVFTNKPAKQ